MENYYSFLGVPREASQADIKKAFREKAKRLHPDIAGKSAEDKMRRLLAAYEVLSDRDRRYEYDRAYFRFVQKAGFDYRVWLSRRNDPESRAKLVFFELLHLEEERALEIWRESGGLDFPMEKYLDREDWMDCVYLLAEELDRRNAGFEAFTLLVRVIREERRLPYFRHFTEDVEARLKDLVRFRLRPLLDDAVWVDCLASLLDLGFSRRDEARWMRSMAEALFRMGDSGAAEGVIREALRRDPALQRIRRPGKKLRAEK
ncbi:MAG: J domain-containing protein [Treponema sp.]|jgi:curved DNA-binding protein CbpA|nr:J domain-containing protein [Treponema sp.]